MHLIGGGRAYEKLLEGAVNSYLPRQYDYGSLKIYLQFSGVRRRRVLAHATT